MIKLLASFDWITKGIRWPFFCAVLIGLSGCESSDQSTTTTTTETTQLRQTSNHLSLALDLIRDYDEYEPTLARNQILMNLNQWAEQQQHDAKWSKDELVDRLPSRYRNFEQLKNLSELQFSQQDVSFLLEASWLRDVAERVSQTNRHLDFTYLIEQVAARLPSSERDTFRRQSDPLAAALRHLDESLTADDSRQLAVCLRLFDWTIRNIQLDPLLPRVDQQVAGPQPEPGKGGQKAASPFAALVQPGPGYRHLPWQTLLYGHGDAWQRARLFIQLARQLRIEVVMLGIDETGRTSSAVPWLPAAWINQKLFLFDTGLGLPLPGPDGEAIATFEQLKTNPHLLRSLDVRGHDANEELSYPVSGHQLEQVVILIDAPVESLSKRMFLIEKQLAGQHKMILSTAPSSVEKQLRNKVGVPVGLWTISLDALIHRFALAQLVKHNQDAADELYRTEQIFEGSHPLVQARRKYFRGVFDSDDDQDLNGAKSLYLQARVSTEFIDRLATIPELQKQVGIVRRPDEDEAAWNTRLRRSAQFYELTRIHAAYWLALAHYESDAVGQAEIWLQRLHEADADDPWKPGIQYNLARTHEAMQNWPMAVRLYRSDTSAQRHGNLLRARLLNERLIRQAAVD